MANLTEANSWDAGVYRIETSDPVLGGETGPANAGAKNLANRTHWLRNQLAGVTATGSWVEVVVTATGPWTCPAGVTKVQILDMCGGGGAGANCYYMTNTGAQGAGGGEGARVQGMILTVVPTTVYTLTIGAGGVAPANASTDHGSWGSQDTALLGGDGGDTSFGALLTTPGGKAAGDTGNTWGADYVSIPGLGGTVTVGGVVYKGEPGQEGVHTTSAAPNNARGGGRLGGAGWMRQTGAATYAAAYSTPGYGCGGCGGWYGAYQPQAQAGGAGIIRFAYPLVSLSGLPSAI